MRFSLILPMTAAIAVGAAAAPGSSLASATTTYLFSPAKADISNVELVQDRRGGRKKWRYQRRHHGERFHRRHGGNRYYRDGWWYSRPFWNLPSFGITVIPGSRSSAHVRWCENRYRSYNRGTDMFFGYDGDYHYCNSPYR